MLDDAKKGKNKCEEELKDIKKTLEQVSDDILEIIKEQTGILGTLPECGA
jgi:hypothetical protein